MIGRCLLYLVFGMACAGLCALGVWQLQRAQEKRERYDAFVERQTAPPLEFDALPEALSAADYLWRRTRLSGHYLDRHAVLDNRVQDQRAGYEVLTPFRTDGGRTVLIDRGWVPVPATRELAPDVLAPADPLALNGYIGREPVVGIELDEAGRAAELMSPQVIRVQRIDVTGLASVLGVELVPVVIYLDADAAGALQVAWHTPGDGSAKHRAYAVQWFAMAAVLAAIGVWNLRRRPNA